MKPLSNEEIDESFDFDDASPLISEMEEFIEDINDFLYYACLVARFKYLPELAKIKVENIKADAIKMRQMYQYSIRNETEEELEERAEDICVEMDIFETMMRVNEEFLDECLAYSDITPKINLQFGIKAYLVSKSAEC